MENENYLNEDVAKHLKKAKTWNMVLLVLGVIGVILSLIGLPGILSPDKSNYDAMGAAGMALYEQANSLSYKSYMIITLIISIALIVMYLRANKTLKNGEAAPKFPYYLDIITTVLGILYSLLFTVKAAIPDVEGVNVGLITQIISILFSLIPALPSVLVLRHLFKLDSEEE
ncbi:MAG: hypothetical protein LBN09_02885 [Clostridioides sp.]|jgi:hypothetical protein|nr:hypothetical protein [Clostridioides sp.]